MNPTLHIIKKDLSRMRWPGLLLVVVVAGQVGIGAALISGLVVSAEAFDRFGWYVKVLVGFQWVISFVLVGWLVHEDSVTHSAAFWVTRPISGARLLVAKVGAIALINLALPALVFLPWWLACGYGVREISRAAAEVASMQALVSASALAVAVMTNSTSRFLGYSFTAGVAFVAWRGLSAAAALPGGASVLPPALADSRSLVVQICVILTAVLVVVHQYLWRRAARSWCVFGSGALITLAAGQFWMWDITSPGGESVADSPELLSLDLQKAVLRDVETAANGDLTAPLELHVTVRGLQPDTVILALRARPLLSWSDGTVFEANELAKDLTLVNRRESVAHAIGLEQWWDRERSGRITLRLPASLADRFERDLPALNLRAEGGLLQTRVVGTVPLRRGACAGRDAHRFRVTTFKLGDAQRAFVTVVETSPAADNGNAPLLLKSLLGPPPDLGQFFVRSDDNSVTHRPKTQHSGLRGMQVGSVNVYLQLLEVWPNRIRSNGSWIQDPEWLQRLNQATLTKVGLFAAGEFRPRLDVAKLAVGQTRPNAPVSEGLP